MWQSIFCALVVVCDWLLMISYLPALCVVYRRHIHKCCPGACKSCPNQPVAATSTHLARASVASYFVKVRSCALIQCIAALCFP